MGEVMNREAELFGVAPPPTVTKLPLWARVLIAIAKGVGFIAGMAVLYVLAMLIAGGAVLGYQHWSQIDAYLASWTDLVPHEVWVAVMALGAGLFLQTVVNKHYAAAERRQQLLKKIDRKLDELNRRDR
jgi:hypothetical protein